MVVVVVVVKQFPVASQQRPLSLVPLTLILMMEVELSHMIQKNWYYNQTLTQKRPLSLVLFPLILATVEGVAMADMSLIQRLLCLKQTRIL